MYRGTEVGTACSHTELVLFPCETMLLKPDSIYPYGHLYSSCSLLAAICATGLQSVLAMLAGPRLDSPSPATVLRQNCDYCVMKKVRFAAVLTITKYAVFTAVIDMLLHCLCCWLTSCCCLLLAASSLPSPWLVPTATSVCRQNRFHHLSHPRGAKTSTSESTSKFSFIFHAGKCSVTGSNEA